MQSHKEIDIIITDDSSVPVDIRELPAFQSVLRLLDEFEMRWQVIFGSKRGQHISHQLVQDMAQTDFVWRVDDDEYPEPKVLERLINVLIEDVVADQDIGAVGSLVLIPPAQPLPANALNIISDLNRPNIQWFKHAKANLLPVEHLTSTFLYRKGVAKYELGLSPASHREETMFTYEIYRAGYKVLVDTGAITWHLRSGSGGIRSHQQHPEYWDQDERLFQSKLKEWGIGCEPTKIIPVDAGRGDHVIVKKLIPELKAKYGKIIMGSCFPDVFEDDNVEQISIAEARQRMGNIENSNIYRRCIDWNWKDTVENAYRKLYDLK